MNKTRRLKAAHAATAILAAAIANGTTAQTIPAPPVSPIPVTNYEYDAEGNPTKTVQAPGTLNYTTRASYDTLGRMKDSTDAKAGLTQYGYDGQDRTTQVTDPRNLVTQYPRNGLGDAKQVISPDTGTASMTYDSAGNLKTRLDSRGALASYTYDELNRLTAVSYKKVGKTTINQGWVYDRTDVPYGIGRLGTVTFPAGNLGITYDALGQVISHKQQVNAATGANSAVITHTVSYGYTLGKLTSITYPSGRKLTITYTGGVATALALAKDASTAGTPLITGIQWKPFGPAKHWDWQMASGAQAHDRVYDTAGRLVRHRLGGSLRDITYDAADRISSYKHYDAATGAAQPELDQSFSYDELGRLTHTTLYSGYWDYSYDANGNRTSATVNGTTNAYTISPTSNRITSISNPTRKLTYDNPGNTTADGYYTAVYDLSGRLSTLTKAGVTSTFHMDALGRRVRKFDSSGADSTVIFVHGQNGELLGEYDQTGKAIKEYVWLGSTPVAVFTPDPASSANPPLVYFIHADHLDTPRIIVDRNGNLRWRWLAEPFGTTAPEDNPGGLGQFVFNLRFPGQYFDQATGLNYNRNRYLDSSLGRYTQFDPVGLAGGSDSGYDYVGSDPLSWVDADGLNRRRTAPLELDYSEPIYAAEVNMLTTQIRRIDPNFTYQTMRPSRGPGSAYSRADVNALARMLRDMLNNRRMCTRDGVEVGRFIGDENGNTMIEPVGGSTVPFGRTGRDTHTLFPNGSNYMRFNPQGHPPRSNTPHGHGHEMGTGPGPSGQGPSLDVFGNVVPWNSAAAHWPIN